MIKLKKLHIQTSFKNLNDLIIDFEKGNGITILIGNNGSGKSNIIEAISQIFAGLYNNELNPSFSYKLNYEKDGTNVEIEYNHSVTKNRYNCNVEKIDTYLPSQIISIYSGEDLRLWNRYYFKFYDTFSKSVISSKQRFSESQKMVFINKYHWNIALLTMIMSGVDLTDILGNKQIENVKFVFDKNTINNITTYNKKNPNEVIAFAMKLLGENQKEKTQCIYSLDQLKEIILDTHNDLFKLLSISLLPKEESWKLISNLELFFSDNYSTEELSEGEKKQILIKFITAIYADDNSIFLLDEPDCHIHPNSKHQIKDLLYNEDGVAHLQSIITTHSPTLTQSFDNNNVNMLVNNGETIKIEEKNKQQIINEITGDFWNYQEQNIFLSSNRSLLLVEGKGDVDYIKKANQILQPSELLNVDMLPFGGTANAKDFIEKIRTCISQDKMIITLFDRDEAGYKGMGKCINITGGRNNTTTYQKDNTVYLMLPKTEEHTDIDFLIEDYFSKEKKIELATKHISEASGHFNKFPKDLRQKVKDDLGKNLDSYSPEELSGFQVLLDKLKSILNGDKNISAENNKTTLS